MTKLLILIVGLAVILGLGALAGRLEFRLVARDRGPRSFEEFLEGLPEDVDREIARKVREEFRSWTGIKDFPVLSTDELEKDYGISDAEDLEDLLERLIAKCGVQLPAGSAAGMRTVGDVVALLNRYSVGRGGR